MLWSKKKSPHAAPSACCPPRGSFLPWGGPAAKKAPTLRLRLALHLAACMPLGFARHTAVRNGLLCVQAHPQGGAFCLGAARRQKKPPRCAFGLRSTSRLVCRSDSLGTQQSAMDCCVSRLIPKEELFALGRPGGKKKPPRYAFGLRSTSRLVCRSDSLGTQQSAMDCCVSRLIPKGELFALGRPSGKKDRECHSTIFVKICSTCP
ncbi:hypothetical protein D6I95_15095 [Alcaligenes faecalis]|nr:hypothetical protein D6I95_15095 [Alcaligenes faecalis]